MTIASIHYINLDHRTDRRTHMTKKLARAPVPAKRLSAVQFTQPPEDLGIPMRPEVAGQAAVAAIFRSHQKAIEAALAYDDTGHAVVLEDDCHFSHSIWKRDIGLNKLPDDWQLVLVSPRFRKINPPPKWSRLSFWQKANPFREKYWLQPLADGEARRSRELTKSYVITGTHFLIYRDHAALRTAQALMANCKALDNVDQFFPSRYAGVLRPSVQRR